MKDYYAELNKHLTNLENGRYGESVEWIVNRITWCWKFKKITLVQMHELADRVTNYLER